MDQAGMILFGLLVMIFLNFAVRGLKAIKSGGSEGERTLPTVFDREMQTEIMETLKVQIQIFLVILQTEHHLK